MTIALHTNCRQTHDARRWPYFHLLADELIRQGHTLYFTGAETDKPYVQSIMGKMMMDNGRVKDYTGQTSWEYLALFLKQVDLLVTINTSVMHLAGALRIPCIALIGGTPAKVVAPRNPEFKYIEAPGLVMSGISLTSVLELIHEHTKENPQAQNRTRAVY